MILDLSDYDIIYEIDQDKNTLSYDEAERFSPHLIKEKWVVVLAVERPEASNDSLSNSYFQSVTITCIKLHSDKDIRILSLTLAILCVVGYNKSCCMTHINQVCDDDRTGYEIEPMKIWGDVFLPMC